MKRLVFAFTLIALCVFPIQAFSENCPNTTLKKDDTYESLNSVLKCLYSRIETLEKQRDRNGTGSNEPAETMQGMSKTRGPFTVSLVRLLLIKEQVKVQFRVQNNGKDTSVYPPSAALNDNRGQEFRLAQFYSQAWAPLKSKEATDNSVYFIRKEAEDAGGDVASTYDVTVTLADGRAQYSFTFYDVKPAPGR